MENKNLLIDASPAKEFFIYMLTRDIPLLRSILDLVDNSIDGITRKGRGVDVSEHYIKITANKVNFSIEDNCGGIPVKIAREYAFKFGRPNSVEPIPGAIGRFGVGMKRTIFKLGNKFKVTSRTENEYFTINEDVREWVKKVDWNFSFSELEEGIKQPAEKSFGTIIEISDLHESVANSFSSEIFISQLISEIRRAYLQHLQQKLKISVNSIPIEYEDLKLLQSNSLRPVFWTKTYDYSSSAPVTVSIYAGLGEREYESGGWTIFCNDRVVLDADQSKITGWGDGQPKYHADFAFFRGYVFFSSANGDLLPWTTTKTGINTDSVLYKDVQKEMQRIIKPILDFLRKLDEERSVSKSEGADDGPLETERKNGEMTLLSKLNPVDIFKAPVPVMKRKLPDIQRIQYSVEKNVFIKVKNNLNAKSITEVGERTFQYYYKMECE